jgi:hypothetical protein
MPVSECGGQSAADWRSGVCRLRETQMPLKRRELQGSRSPHPVDTPPYTPASLMLSRRCLLWFNHRGGSPTQHRQGISMLVSELYAKRPHAPLWESASEDAHNCLSATECTAGGWGGDKPIGFVQHPLFLALGFAALGRKWMQIPLLIKD